MSRTGSVKGPRARAKGTGPEDTPRGTGGAPVPCGHAPARRGYAAVSCFWSDVVVSIWMRRGLTLSLSGSVNCSIP